MYVSRITMPKFADLHDRMEVSAREVVGPTEVTTGDCPGLGRVVAIQTDQGLVLLSEIYFSPPRYTRRSVFYRRLGSPIADVYAWK